MQVIYSFSPRLPPPRLSIVLRLARLRLRLALSSLPTSRSSLLWLPNGFIFALIRLRVTVAVTSSDESLLVRMVLPVTAFLALLRVLLLLTMAAGTKSCQSDTALRSKALKSSQIPPYTSADGAGEDKDYGSDNDVG